MSTGVIFLNLTKAFDLVDHYLLLDKLNAIGLSRSAFLWFNSYLHQRHQCVSYKGAQSKFLGIERDIPQGSSLGPLLFSVFINDLPLSCSHCNIHLYADDIIIYSTKCNIIDINTSLQYDFDSVQQWLLCSKLLLNKSKSFAMLIKKKSTDNDNLNICFSDTSSLATAAHT